LRRIPKRNKALSIVLESLFPIALPSDEERKKAIDEVRFAFFEAQRELERGLAALPKRDDPPIELVIDPALWLFDENPALVERKSDSGIGRVRESRMSHGQSSSAKSSASSVAADTERKRDARDLADGDPLAISTELRHTRPGIAARTGRPRQCGCGSETDDPFATKEQREAAVDRASKILRITRDNLARLADQDYSILRKWVRHRNDAFAKKVTSVKTEAIESKLREILAESNIMAANRPRRPR
jgi:hypothetical protein